MPIALVLLLLAVIGAGMGTVFPVSTVCMQNAVTQAQMGVATGAANFFRALFSALVVAILGAIVLGGLGGVTGMSIEMLARAASAQELAFAFRFVFLACALVLGFGMAFLIAHGGAAAARACALARRRSADRAGNADPGGVTNLI